MSLYGSTFDEKKKKSSLYGQTFNPDFKPVEPLPLERRFQQPNTAPLPSATPIKMPSSHATPAPVKKPDYKSAFIKSTVGSLLGRAVTPLVEKLSGRKVDLSTLPESKTLGEKAVGMLGSLGADLPLWLGGDALLAKPLSMLAKTAPIAKVASVFPKITPALGTGVRAATTFGGPLNAVETAVNGDGVQGFTDRLKQAPLMGLGGSVLHGGGQLIGKGIKEGSFLKSNLAANKRVANMSTPAEDFQSAFFNPTNTRSGTQARLSETFANTQNLMESVKLKPLQKGVDDAVGVRSPLSSQSLAQRELDAQSAFGGPREIKGGSFTTGEQRAFQELQDGITEAQNFVKHTDVLAGYPAGTTVEQAYNDVLKNTGVDLPKLMSNYEKTQNVRGPLTQQERIMGRQAGVIPPLKQREGFPIERPNIEPPLPQRILPESERLTWTNRDVQDAGPLPIRSITADNVRHLPGGMPNSKAVQPITPNPIIDAPIGAPKDVQPITSNIVDAPIGPAREVTAAIGRNPTPNLSVAPVNNLPGGSKTVGAEPIIPDGLTERGVSKNIRTDANRPDALRDSYSVDPLAYQKLGNKETLAKAQGIFGKGIEPAITELDGLIKDLKPEAAPLVKMLADQLTKDGNIVRARELMSNAANRATESGQFGQAFRILRDADAPTMMMVFDKQLAKLNKEGLETYGKKWNNVDLTPDELTMIGNIERGNQASYDSAFEQIHARIANEMPATVMEKVNAWRHISMLLSVKSNVRNIGGNTIMMAMRRAAQRTSGVIQKTFLKEADRTQAVFVSKEYKNLATEHFEANSKELLSGSNKFQEGISLNMPDKRVFRKSRIGEKIGVDIDTLEKTRKFTYALLQKGDSPFFKNAYIDRLGSYAQSKGIKDFSQLPQEAFNTARLEAEQATYKDSSIIADFINKAKRPAKDAGIARKIGAGLVEAAIPFAKTPLNVVKRGIQFSPIGVANGLSGIKSSKGAAAAIDELAKGLTGTGVLGLGYLLASKGILTGKASKDVDMKAYNSNTGHSPFSILGKYSFDWAAPLSIPLAVGVEIYNSIKDSPEDTDKMNNIVTSNNIQKLEKLAANASSAIIDGMNASGDTVFNLSIMKGVKTLLGGQQGVMEGLSQLPQNYATQFIPTALSQIAGEVDPLVRSTYVKGDMPQSFKNALVSRIPVISKTLQPKQTPFGQDMKKIENPVGRAFSQFLSPGIITKDQGINPKIDTELRRLNNVEGLTKQFPTIVPNYIEKTQTHPRITLTPDEATQYQKRVGSLTESSFSKTIGKGSYTNAKANKIKGKSADEVRADLLSNAIADAKAIAKKEILKSRGLK